MSVMKAAVLLFVIVAEASATVFPLSWNTLYPHYYPTPLPSVVLKYYRGGNQGLYNNYLRGGFRQSVGLNKYRSNVFRPAVTRSPAIKYYGGGSHVGINRYPGNKVRPYAGPTYKYYGQGNQIPSTYPVYRGYGALARDRDAFRWDSFDRESLYRRNLYGRRFYGQNRFDRDPYLSARYYANYEAPWLGQYSGLYRNGYNGLYGNRYLRADAEFGGLDSRREVFENRFNAKQEIVENNQSTQRAINEAIRDNTRSNLEARAENFF